MERMQSVSAFIKEEEKCFMQKQAGKTTGDLAAELGIAMEGAGIYAIGYIEEKLSTKFVAELLERPQFQSLMILGYFPDMHGDGEAFGIEFCGEGEPCRHCGAVEETWYALCISEYGAKFDYICRTNFERRPDSPSGGCRIASVKPLMEKYGLLG